MNNGPVIPLGFEVIGTTFVIVYAALTIAALVTLAKSSKISSGQRIVWIVAVILLPLVGAAVWLATYFIERSTLRRQQH